MKWLGKMLRRWWGQWVIADAETSKEYDRREIAQRLREGKQP